MKCLLLASAALAAAFTVGRIYGRGETVELVMRLEHERLMRRLAALRLT